TAAKLREEAEADERRLTDTGGMPAAAVLEAQEIAPVHVPLAAAGHADNRRDAIAKQRAIAEDLDAELARQQARAWRLRRRYLALRRQYAQTHYQQALAAAQHKLTN